MTDFRTARGPRQTQGSRHAPADLAARAARFVRRAALAGTLAAPGLLAGCVQVQPLPARTVASRPAAPTKDYGRELPPGAHALRKLPAGEWPDLAGALEDRAELARALEGSVRYLSKPSSRGFFPVSGVEHGRALASAEALLALCRGPASDAEVEAAVRARFDLYTSVGCDDQGTVLFTGYYTPIFDAAREPGGRFQFPIHRLPPDHVKDPRTGETLGRLRPDGTVDAAYPDRATLLGSGDLEGLELAWLADPFEAYVLQVQGSGVLRLESGETFEVGYAGNNGHAYASVGAELVRQGKLRRDQLSLKSLIDHFRAHPEDFGPMTATNRRYVFFQEGAGRGPLGCLNEPVLAGRSIATDKAIFPRGAPCLIDTVLPGGPAASPTRVRRVVVDQDAGGAIRAPGRCDVYMGIGDEAGRAAGRTLSEGRLYYLLLRDDADDEVAATSADRRVAGR